MGGKKSDNRKDNNNKHQKQEDDRDKSKKKRKEKGKKTDEEFQQHLKEFNLELLPYELEIRDVQGDGNCLFRSIADQLEGNEQIHMYYRKLAVEQLQKRRDFFKNFLFDQDYDEYLSEMAKPGNWGGNLEIQAISQSQGHNFVIHMKGKAELVIKGKAVKNIEKKTIHIAFHQENEGEEHYSSVRNRGDKEFDTPAEPIQHSKYRILEEQLNKDDILEVKEPEVKEEKTVKEQKGNKKQIGSSKRDKEKENKKKNKNRQKNKEEEEQDEEKQEENEQISRKQQQDFDEQEKNNKDDDDDNLAESSEESKRNEEKIIKKLVSKLERMKISDKEEEDERRKRKQKKGNKNKNDVIEDRGVEKQQAKEIVFI